MMLSTLNMAVLPDKRNEALRILKLTAQLARVKQGCQGSHIYEDVQEANMLMVMEMWHSEEDLMRHLRSDEYRNILLVMEMAASAPIVRFDTISGFTGIETVEAARQRK
jgi:quinol monooxygenase YgiN